MAQNLPSPLNTASLNLYRTYVPDLGVHSMLKIVQIPGNKFCLTAFQRNKAVGSQKLRLQMQLCSTAVCLYQVMDRLSMLEEKVSMQLDQLVRLQETKVEAIRTGMREGLEEASRAGSPTRTPSPPRRPHSRHGASASPHQGTPWEERHGRSQHRTDRFYYTSEDSRRPGGQRRSRCVSHLRS